MRWFVRIKPSLLDDYEFSILPDVVKWRHIQLAIAGQSSAASKYIRTGRERAYSSRWRRIRSLVLANVTACHYCRSNTGPFEVDHVIPLCRGGKDEPFNAVGACRPCNRSKGGKLLAEWRGAQA